MDTLRESEAVSVHVPVFLVPALRMPQHRAQAFWKTESALEMAHDASPGREGEEMSEFVTIPVYVLVSLGVACWGIGVCIGLAVRFTKG